MPDAGIGADVMVGFPGETDAEFEESRAFIESLPFTYLHVFTYSERPGTPAASAPGSVPMPVRKGRNRILREIAEAKKATFARSFVGRTVAAVTIEDGRTALSHNYLKIELATARQPNCLVEVRIGELGSRGIVREHPVFCVLS